MARRWGLWPRRCVLGALRPGFRARTGAFAQPKGGQGTRKDCREQDDRDEGEKRETHDCNGRMARQDFTRR